MRPSPDATIDVSVVVPARNAEALLDGCLGSIAASRPREIIVVDGNSTDRTVEVARRHADVVVSDGGRGLPVARMLGVQAARCPLVVLIDADIILPDGTLAALVDEFVEGGYVALQAGLGSISGDGYWGRALTHHHRTGVSKNWFGVMATVFERDTLLDIGFDPGFLSGEDIDLRWRLVRAGARIGVSRRTCVIHRFDDSFDFARDQWLADGHGLGRMIRKHGAGGAWLLFLPVLAASRGVALSVVRWRQPRWIPYYASYCLFNYMGMARALKRRPPAVLLCAEGRM